MIKECTNCKSNKVKKSLAYPDMWFCGECGHGDYVNKPPTIEPDLSIEMRMFSKDYHLRDFVDTTKKNLIITSKDNLPECLRQVPTARVVFRDGVNTQDPQYYKVCENSPGVYIYLEESPEIIIDSDYARFRIDRVILHKAKRDTKQYVLEHLEQLYTYSNWLGSLKNMKAYILGLRKESKYKV